MLCLNVELKEGFRVDEEDRFAREGKVNVWLFKVDGTRIIYIWINEVEKELLIVLVLINQRNGSACNDLFHYFEEFISILLDKCRPK